MQIKLFLLIVIIFCLNAAQSDDNIRKKYLIKAIRNRITELDIDHISNDDLISILTSFNLPKMRQRKKISNLPIVVNTWPFVNATSKAWQVLSSTDDAIKAVIEGCSECEDLRCDGTVGFGGSPDESAETALDALIMDGKTHDAGSVASLKRVKSAIRVANAVRLHTLHTLIVGEQATEFSIEMGFQQEDLHAVDSVQKWSSWFNNSCQPNFRINVLPNASSTCGPYKPILDKHLQTTEKRYNKHVSKYSHDTIGMIAIDSKGNIAGGTSTNGASYKIPGRVGDSPIIGSGAYVDNEIGGACGTGDGDTLMKFLPAYQAVESMRHGMSPDAATEDAILRIMKHYENFVGAIVAVDKFGNHGAACHGLETFPYSFKDSQSDDVQIKYVPCI